MVEGEGRGKAHLTWQWAGEVPSKRGKPLIKPSDLMRTHYHENSMGEPPPRFNYLPLGPSHDRWRLWELQFKMRFGWGHSQTISVSVDSKFNNGQFPESSSLCGSYRHLGI